MLQSHGGRWATVFISGRKGGPREDVPEWGHLQMCHLHLLGPEEATVSDRHLSLNVHIPALIFTEYLLYTGHGASQVPQALSSVPQVQADCELQRSSQNIQVFVIS